MSKRMSLSGCRLKRERAQAKECKKGGPIALQPPQSESHCLSASMTEQPFLRLIPPDIKENLECQKKCRLQDASSSVRELNKRSARRAASFPFNLHHCLSTSMTEQPFLRLIPPDIKENLECQKRRASPFVSAPFGPSHVEVVEQRVIRGYLAASGERSRCPDFTDTT